MDSRLFMVAAPDRGLDPWVLQPTRGGPERCSPCLAHGGGMWTLESGTHMNRNQHLYAYLVGGLFLASIKTLLCMLCVHCRRFVQQQNPRWIKVKSSTKPFISMLIPSPSHELVETRTLGRSEVQTRPNRRSSCCSSKSHATRVWCSEVGLDEPW